MKVVHSSATEVCTCGPDWEFQKGDYVVLPTRYGDDIGRILGVLKNPLESDRSASIPVQRKANEADIERFEKNKDKDKKAFQVCCDKIREHALDMKLVSAHHLFNESKILFYFTAESRIDFRTLVKDLVSVFKIRIELRQIGVRDESRVLGGMGVCGRGYCCHSLTDKLNPVSIKMAKKQNLSLNSMKISGPCGRLLCCLAYEYGCYKSISENLPSEGTMLALDDEKCEVYDINVVKEKVKLRCSSGRIVELPFEGFEYDENTRAWKIVT